MTAATPFSCPFCASLPFSDFDSYSDHFINIHRESLFPVPDSWGTRELGILAKLVVLFENYLPGLRFIKIKLSALVGCESVRIKRAKERNDYKNLLTRARNPPAVPVLPVSPPLSPMLIDLEAMDSCDSQAADINRDISVIIDEVRNISTVLKENSDPTGLSDSISSSFNTLLPFGCLFCDRRFSTLSGLGLHKKSRHFDEFLLEIEMKFSKRRNHPWNEEELRIMYSFEQDLIAKGVRHVNIELSKIINHRTYSQIAEIRKSMRYKNLKEKLYFEFASGVALPPSPSTLLSPMPRLPLSLPIITNPLSSIADEPTNGRLSGVSMEPHIGSSPILDSKAPSRQPDTFDSAGSDSPLSAFPFADTSLPTCLPEVPFVRGSTDLCSTPNPSISKTELFTAIDDDDDAGVLPGVSSTHCVSPPLSVEFYQPAFVNLPAEDLSPFRRSASVVDQSPQAFPPVSLVTPDLDCSPSASQANLPSAVFAPCTSGTNFQDIQVEPPVLTAGHSSPSTMNNNTDDILNPLELKVFNFVVNLPSVKNLPVYPLPSRIRLTRGVRAQGESSCRRGCNYTETTHHVIQQCP